MANPTQNRERRSRYDLLPQMEKASAWLAADPNRKVKEALTRFDLEGAYSAFWLLHFRRMNPTQIVPQAQIDKWGGVESAGFANHVAQMRDQKKRSWGEIAACLGDGPFGISEATVRRMYTKATNKHHQGSRIGHGGRWLGGVEYHEALYRGAEGEPDRKAEGTTLEPGTKAYEAAERILRERAERQKAQAQARKASAKRPTRTARKAS